MTRRRLRVLLLKRGFTLETGWYPVCSWQEVWINGLVRVVLTVVNSAEHRVEAEVFRADDRQIAIVYDNPANLREALR